MDVDAVESAWHDLKRAVDHQTSRAPRGDGITLKEVAGKFLARQERRRESGSVLKPLSAHTFRDYVKTLELLRDVWGADRDVTSLKPSDFDKVLARFQGRAPSTVARTIAYVRAFFAYAVKAEIIPDTPRFGPDFTKPHQQAHRDNRMAKVKAYQPAEICTLWKAATHEERCWMGLGIACAFDNSDISSLTRDVVDLKAGVIDFRRRKTGLVRRVCPIPPNVVKLLKAYERPKPVDAKLDDRFFLTANGYPLVRIQVHKKDPMRTVEIDALSLRWKRLQSRAGLRPPIVVAQRGGVRTEKYPKGDGRGFRSLRTTFSNLAPFGFREEVEIIMGHAHGSVLLDNYLESVGLDRLKQLMRAVWRAAFTTKKPRGEGRRGMPAPSGQPTRAERKPNPSE
jgi:integrase